MTSPPSNALMDRLVEVVVDLSGYAPDEVAPDATFMELGFDSLFLTQLSQALKQAYGVEITFRELMESWPTLEAVAGRIAEAAPEAVAEPEALYGSTEEDAGTNGVEAVLPELPTPTGSPAEPPGSMRALFAQQLDVMARQLEMLRGRPAGATKPKQAAESPEAAPIGPPAERPAASKPKPVAKPKPKPAPEVQRDGSDGELTPHQREHLRLFAERYNAKTPGSKAHTRAHRPHHADPRTAAGFDRRWKDLVYPLVVERSKGSKLWDVDGNEYVDLLNGFGPIMLGHSPDFVEEAVRAQLDRGFEIGPQTPLAGETAELVCELTGMDRASFVCTGSEAVQAAIRCARTVTARTKIVTFAGAYHGNFDEVIVRSANRGDRLKTLPAAPGIPRRATEDVIVLPYGEEASLEVIRRHADELAAVLVEPVQSRRPELQPRAFLRELREITRASGSALIFDEVVTGFRTHPGGAQAIFGVEADLATYGKVVAGGLPIGVVAGRGRWMDTFDGGMWDYGDDSVPEAGVTFFAGTFVRHPLAMAAAHATLSHLKAEGPALQERLNATTERFAERVNALFRERGVPLSLPHFASVMFLRVDSDSEVARLVFPTLRLNGVHVQDHFPSYLTTAHTEADLDRVVEAFRASVEAMQEARFLPPPKRVRQPAPAPKPREVPSQPPVPGARLGRGPDGKPAWYVKDPDRPNGYLRVG